MIKINLKPPTKWAAIKGFEHYLISSSGTIFNVKRMAIKKPSFDRKGYLRVRLISGSFGKNERIHRLVAKAFLPDFSSALQVNHKNCIKSDNRLENLEMVNQSQNTKHAWDNKRMKLSSKGADGKFSKKAA